MFTKRAFFSPESFKIHFLRLWLQNHLKYQTI